MILDEESQMQSEVLHLQTHITIPFFSPLNPFCHLLQDKEIGRGHFSYSPLEHQTHAQNARACTEITAVKVLKTHTSLCTRAALP